MNTLGTLTASMMMKRRIFDRASDVGIDGGSDVCMIRVSFVVMIAGKTPASNGLCLSSSHRLSSSMAVTLECRRGSAARLMSLALFTFLFYFSSSEEEHTARSPI